MRFAKCSLIPDTLAISSTGALASSRIPPKRCNNACLRFDPTPSISSRVDSNLFFVFFYDEQ